MDKKWTGEEWTQCATCEDEAQLKTMLNWPRPGMCENRFICPNCADIARARESKGIEQKEYAVTVRQVVTFEHVEYVFADSEEEAKQAARDCFICDWECADHGPEEVVAIEVFTDGEGVCVSDL